VRCHTLPLSSKEGLKNAKWSFFCQKCTSLEKSKFLYVNTVSVKVVRNSLAFLSVKKWFVGRPILRENLAETDPPPS